MKFRFRTVKSRNNTKTGESLQGIVNFGKTLQNRILTERKIIA